MLRLFTVDFYVDVQVADTALPISGEDGSLTVNNDIVIDTNAPYVIAVLSLREGIYTMGETVDLQVKFGLKTKSKHE